MEKTAKLAALATVSLSLATETALDAELIADKPKFQGNTFLTQGKKEYPNHLGFNGLYIQAIRPEGNSEAGLSPN